MVKEFQFRIFQFSINFCQFPEIKLLSIISHFFTLKNKCSQFCGLLCLRILNCERKINYSKYCTIQCPSIFYKYKILQYSRHIFLLGFLKICVVNFLLLFKTKVYSLSLMYSDYCIYITHIRVNLLHTLFYFNSSDKFGALSVLLSRNPHKYPHNQFHLKILLF